MDTTARDEANRPLGVIGCLAAGFETLSHNLWPLAMSVLLDLFLWFGPRLSVAPLLRWFVTFLRSQPVHAPETTYQVSQAVQLLEEFGRQFNLFSFLSFLPLFNVPSLLTSHAPGMVSPLGERHVLPVTNVLALMSWGIVLAPIGLALGSLYLNSVARRVGAAWSAENAPTSSRAGRLIRVFLFTAGALVVGAAITPLWFLLVGTAMAVAELLGVAIWTLSVGIASYIVLHLLFVVHGVLLGGRGLLRAIWESIVLIHTHLPSVVGLVVLAAIIYEGLGYVWSLPSGDSWLLLIGILADSCIATALTTATFVFYREQIRLLSERQRVSART